MRPHRDERVRQSQVHVLDYFGGQDCSKDRSPSARRQKLVEARKKALPTRANLKQRQKEVKDLAKEILQEEICQGCQLETSY